MPVRIMIPVSIIITTIIYFVYFVGGSERRDDIYD